MFACLTGDFDASDLTDGEQNQVCFLSVLLHSLCLTTLFDFEDEQ